MQNGLFFVDTYVHFSNVGPFRMDPPEATGSYWLPGASGAPMQNGSFFESEAAVVISADGGIY
jgi:hypothetical protein